MKYYIKAALIMSCLFTFKVFAQDKYYWQQEANYSMQIDFDVSKHQFSGTQEIEYFNNSPDTLKKVFYHLYYNAFQPGSMMSAKRQQTAYADSRFPLMDKIDELKDNEIGFHKISSLKQDGRPLTFEIENTIMEVQLATPILPGKKTFFSMEFNSQVPLQIRRTGRDSFDGVDYSMTQWYPKLAEYDKTGWHAHPYIAREFYSPWGNYEVDITISKKYLIAGTGIVENANEVGYGYEDEGIDVKRKGKTLTWKFRAKNIHDFAWAADKEYKQVVRKLTDGPTLRFFFIPGEETKLWEKELPDYTEKAFSYLQENVGKYLWPQFSVIQGGDGGMEYNMATLIINKKRKSGVRSLNSLVGTTVHEALHNWYQGMIATNESYNAWMDEGFVSYVEDYCLDYIYEKNEKLPAAGLVNTYVKWAISGNEEPSSVHADYFMSDRAYGRASYTKGAVALLQLNYIMGEEKLMSGLRQYHKKWSLKHPGKEDFIHLMELHSGLDLNWFFDRWIYTTYTIDYAIGKVSEQKNGSNIEIIREGLIPMPLDITVTLKDGQKIMYYIPLSVMRGIKENDLDYERIQLPDWWWIKTSYDFDIDLTISDIQSIEIDESGRMADVNRENNLYNSEK
jgi:hypothetical protein